MKKSSIYRLALLAIIAGLCVLQACKKGNEYPSKVVTISYPVVTLKGPADTTINRGATWVDPGATWSDTYTGEQGTITFAINSGVDSAYLLYYVATNKNGFISVYNPNDLIPVTRGVAVTNIGNSTDISGSYTNNGPFGASSANVTKVSRGLFAIDNVDGFSDPGVIAIKSDSTVSIATVWPVYIAASSFSTYISSASIPEVFTQTSIIYQAAAIYTGNPPHLTPQPPVIISFTETPTNVPGMTVTLDHN